MIQTASLLAVGTVFIGLWTLISTFYSQRGGGGTLHETKLMRKGGGGGRNCRTLWYYK